MELQEETAHVGCHNGKPTAAALANCGPTEIWAVSYECELCVH